MVDVTLAFTIPQEHAADVVAALRHRHEDRSEMGDREFAIEFIKGIVKDRYRRWKRHTANDATVPGDLIEETP